MQKVETYFKKIIISLMENLFLIFLLSMINFWTKNDPKRISIIPTIVLIDLCFTFLLPFTSMFTHMMMQNFFKWRKGSSEKTRLGAPPWAFLTAESSLEFFQLLIVFEKTRPRLFLSSRERKFVQQNR